MGNGIIGTEQGMVQGGDRMWSVGKVAGRKAKEGKGKGRKGRHELHTYRGMGGVAGMW